MTRPGVTRPGVTRPGVARPGATRAGVARPGARGVVFNTVFAFLAVAIAAAPFWPVYRTPQFLIMAGVTIAAGCALAIAGALGRWPTAVMVPAVAALYLLLGVPLAIPDQAAHGALPTASGELMLIRATALSWKQLVTISIPVGAYQALLVPPFILILLTAVTALTVAVRSRHGEAAVIAPILLLASAIMLGPATPRAPVSTALLLLGVLLFWLIGFRWRRRSAAIRALAAQSGVMVETAKERRLAGARLVSGAAVILLLAGAAGGTAAVLVPPAGPRQVVRTSVAQPFDPRDYPSPLVGFRSYLESGRAGLPMFTVTGLHGYRRIRVATLDSYNGVVYSVGGGSGSFTRMPYPLDQKTAGGHPITLHVAVQGYSGVWLPGVGQLRQVTFTGPDAEEMRDSFFYNDGTGTAVVTRGVDSGDSYTVDAVTRPSRTASQLASARPGSAVLPKAAVVPDELVSTLQDYTASAATPGAKLEAALKGLATNGYVSHGIGSEPASRSGHSADRIRQLLTDVPMIGDQEQYAVTAALMARQLGFPARVVFGFVLPHDTAATGPVTFTGADVSAWIEVQTRQDGWVSVDPTPPVRPVPEKQPEVPRQIARPQAVVQPPAEETTKQPQDAPRSRVDQQQESRLGGLAAVLLAVATVAGWSVLVLAVLASPFLAVIAAKRRRRTLRSRAPDSLERIAGGWQEFQDAALDYGYTPPPGTTRVEFAQGVGGMRALVLASRTDMAVFGPDAPDPADAEAVWHDVHALRASLEAERTRWQRFTAAVSLRSLGGYRGRRGRRVPRRSRGSGGSSG